MFAAEWIDEVIVEMRNRVAAVCDKNDENRRHTLSFFGRNPTSREHFYGQAIGRM
jgi:hypothetical protein